MTATATEAPKVKVKLSDKERDMKMVKGVFRCFEPMGGSVRLAYRKHKGEPIRNYDLKDGQEYTIPYGLAMHLRENCGYFTHGHILDAQGNPFVDRQNKRVERMTFEPLGFNFDS